MLRNTVSIDSGNAKELVMLRREVQFKLGGMGDPLLILIRLETAAERQLACTRRCITNDIEYINNFINRHI